MIDFRLILYQTRGTIVTQPMVTYTIPKHWKEREKQDSDTTRNILLISVHRDGNSYTDTLRTY